MPFSAAVAETIVIDPATNPGSNEMETFSVPTGNSARIISGSGLVLGSGGMSAGSLHVGMESNGTANGQVFVEPTAAHNYSIRSDGNISITGLLEVLEGYSLGVGAKTSGGKINTVSIGSINATGGLTLQDVGTLNTGNITSWDDLNITADAMTTTGTIFSRAGDSTFNVAGTLSVSEDFITDGVATTQTEINVGDLSVGRFQNKVGSVVIESDGEISSTGSFENSGTLLKITGATAGNAPDMTVDGTMKNDSNAGTMTLVLNSLTINGGLDDNASFVNKGNLGIVVTGQTYLKNGFDLSAMNADNTFSLHTGTLVMEGGADRLLQVFANNILSSFELVVDNGSITAGNIINGQGSSGANMTLGAGDDITASLIQNYGQELYIYTIEDSGADINITSATVNGASIVGDSGTTTRIIADGTLSATGAVSNAGTMILNGNEIELTSVANTGDLRIAAQTDPTGSIHLTGGVSTSAGTTEIDARQIAIEGVVSTTGGTTTIRGSDVSEGSVVIGGINALGGVTNLNALIHSVDISGDLLVSNGAFNVGADTYNLNVGGGTQIGGDLTFSGTPLASEDAGNGNVNIANGGTNRFVLTSGGQIHVSGSVIATENDMARTGSLVADVIEVGGDVTADNKGFITFGAADPDDESSTTLSVAGDVTSDNGGTVEIYSDAATVKSLSGSGKFILHGDSVSATTGNIDIDNGIWYDGSNPTKGVIINGTDEITLETTASGQDVDVAGGISVSNGKLNIVSASDANIDGAVTADTANGKLYVTASDGAATFTGGTMTASNGGVIVVNADTIEAGAIDVKANSAVTLGSNETTSVETTALVSNAGTLDIVADDITMTGLKSTGGTTNVNAADALEIASVDVSGGVVALYGETIESDSMSLSGGTTSLYSDAIDVSGDIVISDGDLNQGGTVGTLILTESGTLSANNLRVNNGNLVVEGSEVEYNIDNTARFANGIETIAGNAIVNAKDIITGGTVTNAAGLTLNSTNSLALGVVSNTGNLVLKSEAGNITADSFSNTAGTSKITAKNMTVNGALTSTGILYQNYAGTLGAGDINITSTNHNLTAGNLTVGGINQYGSSVMKIISSDVTVNGSIFAKDLRIQANPTGNWLNVDVSGNVSGGVDFVGLEHMHIGGNYTFDDNSMLHAAILPNPGVVMNATTYNYWATVSLANDNTLGQITNAATNAAPLISVDGQFIYNVSNVGNASAELSGSSLINPQIGIDIFDMVDSGTAIWLLHSDSADGLAELSDKIRNLNVNFCNADGTKCFRYFDSSIAENSDASQTEMNLPAYLTVRDVDEDGVTDSIYIVFDSRFGGPVQVFKIQPIVARVDDHTGGEYDSAGALDDLVEGGLKDAKFNNRSPIEAIPVAFKGTNFENLANELYGRMEQYVLDRDGTALARFSRLVQPREIEHLAGSVALEEHTFFRDFEDHMLDEFIWNRHRSLKKAWLDADYGLFYQNTSDGKHVNGDRFSIVGGFDCQNSPTLILGVAGHISHMSADDTDAMDLTYIPGKRVDGHVSYDVSDTDIGVGAYLMKILGVKTRLYGNAFLDLHLLDVSREQNFVSHIDGSGTAFSVISEWGFLHDWLNQYIVGNLYARVGYNFGFSVKEEAGGDEYMHLESDGYMILTPGYSLIAQKRFYPSSWFQIRPYISAGVEYDVLGTPDYAKFKFGPAKSYTKYDIEIDPLWANIGGGVELLSASGFQVGLDYRYQYNYDLQLHKVRLSGLYRF